MLRDVAALSPTDAWAVGFGTNYQALVEHWDGTSWSIVPVTGVPSDSPLYGVQAFADDDVWAVGSTGDRGLIVHWDGASWSPVPFPTPAGATYTFLQKVAGVAPDDVWATGASEGTTDQLLFLHWNGSAWSMVSAPTPGEYRFVRGMTALSSTDVWVVGDWEEPAPSYTEHPLVEHWNGTAWSSVKSPLGTEPWGVTSVSGSDAWLVGVTGSASSSYAATAEHWNGTSWATVPGPNPGPGDSELLGIAALPDGTLYAVGDHDVGSDVQPLIERLSP